MSEQAILNVQKASLAFGDRSIWKDLDLSVAPGEFIAVIGANGSGKTVLLKAILGQLQLSAGEIELLGSKVPHGSRQIGYIPQHRQADSGLPLRSRDLLRMGLDGHRFGIPFPSRPTAKKVSRMLEAVGAEDIANTPIGQLSGGQLQRIRVAQAVIDNPKLILADEPLSALDLKQQSLVAELIDSQRKQNGAAVLFVTLNNTEIVLIVDFINRGGKCILNFEANLIIGGNSFLCFTVDSKITFLKFKILDISTAIRPPKDRPIITESTSKD